MTSEFERRKLCACILVFRLLYLAVEMSSSVPHLDVPAATLLLRFP